MRRWTLIALIALLLLLMAVAVYQISLANRRAELPDPGSSPTVTP